MPPKGLRIPHHKAGTGVVNAPQLRAWEGAWFQLSLWQRGCRVKGQLRLAKQKVHLSGKIQRRENC